MGVFLLISTPLAAGKVLIANLIWLFQVTGNVRFGSSAALRRYLSSTAASGGKAAPQRTENDSEILNVCFHQ
jgi:hypothetical protein